jgi:hypothetical protein
MTQFAADLAVDGFCARVDGVRAEFERNFADRREMGASVCVRAGGTTVVDPWGGVVDPRQRAVLGPRHGQRDLPGHCNTAIGFRPKHYQVPRRISVLLRLGHRGSTAPSADPHTSADPGARSGSHWCFACLYSYLTQRHAGGSGC